MASDSQRYFRVLEDNDLLSPCPSCGVADWGSAATQIISSAYDPGGDYERFGYTAVTLICDNCGLMQMHHTPVLDRRLPGAGEAPDQQDDGD
ncbi:MAG TPA: hypothetical protein VG448_10280 [Solirubrobacterales bacterium]|nr:hypothetical protein [Solirubrobacterales bacterium]